MRRVELWLAGLGLLLTGWGASMTILHWLGRR
jgi:hypothetical protein